MTRQSARWSCSWAPTETRPSVQDPGVEALLLTVGMVALMVLVLALVARFWPRSSGLGGYRARGGAEDGHEPPVREDDDTHWNWTDDGSGGPGDTESRTER